MPPLERANGTCNEALIPGGRRERLLRTALELARVHDLHAAQTYLRINAASADLCQQFQSALARQETSALRTTLAARLQVRLAELPLPTLCINALQREARQVVRNILCSDAELLGIPHIGPFSVEHIDSCLQGIGIERHADGSYTDLWAHPTEDSPS